MKRVSLIAIVFQLIGCATPYEQPSDASKSSRLTAIHLTDSFPSSTNIDVYGSEECTKASNQGRIVKIGKATDLHTTQVTANIRSGERVYLAVEGWTQGNYTGTTYTNYTCTNLVSFVPEAGKSYTVTQKVFEHNKCTARLIEDETSSAPATFERHSVAKACKTKGY